MAQVAVLIGTNLHCWLAAAWMCSGAVRWDAGHANPGGYLTLRRLVVWLAEPLIRMRGLAGIAEATAHREGGELINAVDALAQHGDVLVQHFVSRALEQMCQPLFEMARDWVFNGRLSNAGHEFFISSNGTALHDVVCDRVSLQRQC